MPVTEGAPLRVALVVGAGGPTGGPFIHAALLELARHTGWTAPAASTILGTSAGAFVAASVDAEERSTTQAQLAALAALDNGASYSAGRRHRVVAIARLFGGLLVARMAPRSRPLAAYEVAPSPYHDGALVVTVVRKSARRMVHHLATANDARAIVRASAAIPGVNQPVPVDGDAHVDGATNSPTNVDLIDPHDHDALVVIAPMVAGAGGSALARTDRAQLRSQLRHWVRSGKPTIVVTPNQEEHTNRRIRETFALAGTHSVQRLLR